MKTTLYEWAIANSKNNIIEEWDYDKNSPLKPENVSYSSGMSVWWKCSKGHTWKSAINNRIRWSGCPYCSNKQVWKGFNDFDSQCKIYNKDKLLKEWIEEKNRKELKLTPDSVLYGSNKYAWWKCSRCGHEWKAKIYTRTGRGDGCPNCRKETATLPREAVSECLLWVRAVWTLPLRWAAVRTT